MFAHVNVVHSLNTVRCYMYVKTTGRVMEIQAWLRTCPRTQKAILWPYRNNLVVFSRKERLGEVGKQPRVMVKGHVHHLVVDQQYHSLLLSQLGWIRESEHLGGA